MPLPAEKMTVISNLDELKKNVFYDMLELAGRVFILARYAPDVVIGDRGFLPEEKEKGIVLVFNKRMNFEWGSDGISAKLVFGSVTHQCFIPIEAIISVFSPELSAQFSASPESRSSGKEAKKRSARSEAKPSKSPGNKVVRIDFNKKK